MTQGPRILVVDRVSDTEQVLRAVLSPRGIEVDRISRGPSSAAAPSLVVIDEESTDACSPDVNWSGVPQVIIGTADLPDSDDCRVLQKPFQYAELIQAIEQLIATRRAA